MYNICTIFVYDIRVLLCRCRPGSVPTECSQPSRVGRRGCRPCLAKDLPWFTQCTQVLPETYSGDYGHVVPL